ncbi:MAG: hypothetical protein J6S85_03925 [Methanobrevibacter sp.]|nr:hypothetical protein [Methanobrevibacter sp.]MBO7712691.1 hypothetical protein [Methanobrevibacter sp.]
MNYPFNYYGQPMMPPMQQPLPVQTIQQVQKTAQFYNVEDVGELDGVKPTLNVLYVGFNKKKKEIYLKQLTNDGLISLETYELAGDKKEKSELETILEKINIIENKLGGSNVPNNTANGTNGNATVNVG